MFYPINQVRFLICLAFVNIANFSSFWTFLWIANILFGQKTANLENWRQKGKKNIFLPWSILQFLLIFLIIALTPYFKLPDLVFHFRIWCTIPWNSVDMLTLNLQRRKSFHSCSHIYMNGLPLYIQNRLGCLCRKLNNSSFLCQCQTSKGPTTYWVVFKEQLKKKNQQKNESQGFCKANACRKPLVVMEWNPIFIVHSVLSDTLHQSFLLYILFSGINWVLLLF